MKEIEYNGYKFLYRIREYECGDYGCYVGYETFLYDPEPIKKTRKKYYLFGPQIEYTEFKHVYTLDYSIESRDVTKGRVRKSLNHLIALIEREKEVENGIFV